MTGFSLGKVKVKNRLVMAPVAGYTTSAWRALVKEFGCGLTYSELISACGLYYNEERTFNYLNIDDVERPVTLQLFGSDPDVMAEAAQRAESAADIIDLNFACPAQKVIRNNSGAALLKDIDLAVKVAGKVSRSVSKPVTAKIRLGWSESGTAAALIPRLAEAGIKGVAVHGRTAIQQFRGLSDWQSIEELAENAMIPVIGNGDLADPADIANRLRNTACAALMIGRGALGNPWIFRQTLDIIQGLPRTEPAMQQKIETILKFAQMTAVKIGPERAAKDLRKHLILFFRGMPGAHELRKKLVTLKDMDELERILGEFVTGTDKTKH